MKNSDNFFLLLGGVCWITTYNVTFFHYYDCVRFEVLTLVLLNTRIL